MSIGLRRSFSSIYFPALLIFAFLTSVAVFWVLGPVAGIKSGYVFIGLTFAFVVYHAYEKTHSGTKFRIERLWQRAYLGRLVFVIVFFSVTVVAVASELPFVDASLARTGVLVIGLPVGYTLLVVQIRQEASLSWLLAQIIALFTLDPFTKYLSTNFYFGRGDIPKHVHFTELISSTGTWQSIPEDNLYHFFPGLQSLLGSVNLLSGVPPYESLVITGIITYVAVIITAYSLAKMVFDDWLFPICIAMSVTLLGPIHRYSVYFFPQSLAVGLALIVILAALRYNAVNAVEYWKHALLSLPIVVALWFTHHLTTVLFVPILLVLVAAPMLANRVGFDGVIRPQLLPLVAWVGGSVVYWEVYGLFISNLIDDVMMILGNAQTSSSDAGAAIVSLGTRIPEPSVIEALLSLTSPDAVYNIMLVCVFALGILGVLCAPNRFRRAGALITVGVLSAAAMIRIPLDIHGLARMQLPVSIFVAFLIGASLYRFFPLSERSLMKVAPGLFVIVLLAISGSAYAADDLYGLHSGPDLWETRTLPETQKEFSAAEMGSFQQSAAFVGRHDVSLGSDWNSAIGLTRYRYDLPVESFTVEGGRITTEQDLVIYRHRWVERSVRLVPERTSFVTVLISDEWLRGMAWRENKVYTTGEVSMIADRQDAMYFDARTEF